MEPALHYVNILTADLDISIDFYQRMLGMQLASRDPQPGTAQVAFLRDGPLSSPFFLKLTGPPFSGWTLQEFEKRGPRLDHVSFRVDDVDAWHEKLMKQGVEVVAPPHLGSSGREMVFRDDSDVLVALIAVADSTSFVQCPPRVGEEDRPVFNLHHVSISCQDTAAKERFYQTTLGLETVFGIREEGLVFMADPSLRTDESRSGPMLEIIGEPGLWEREAALVRRFGPCLDHISFQVDDVDAACDDLRSRGAEFETEPMDYGTARIAFFRDPNGVHFEIEPFFPEEVYRGWRGNR